MLSFSVIDGCHRLIPSLTHKRLVFASIPSLLVIDLNVLYGFAFREPSFLVRLDLVFFCFSYYFLPLDVIVIVPRKTILIGKYKLAISINHFKKCQNILLKDQMKCYCNFEMLSGRICTLIIYMVIFTYVRLRL